MNDGEWRTRVASGRREGRITAITRDLQSQRLQASVAIAYFAWQALGLDDVESLSSPEEVYRYSTSEECCRLLVPHPVQVSSISNG